MRLLVFHQLPAQNFFQQHVASYLHKIGIVLQNLVISPSPASLSRLLSAVCSVKQDLLVYAVNAQCKLKKFEILSQSIVHV